MITFTAMHPRFDADMLGLLPDFFDAADPRPAREQINEHYAHGGGWNPITQFALRGNRLLYPGDPPFLALAEARLRDERIVFFQYSFLAIIQPDGTYEIARVD